MISPDSVLVMVPVYSRKLDFLCSGGLVSCAAAGMLKHHAYLPECNPVNLARNVAAAEFLRSPYDWLVFIDDDIGFSPDDYAILMDWGKDPPPPINQELHDAATLAEFTPHNRPSFKTPLAVAAEYSRKSEGAPPARLGLGFARIHRSVFAALDALNLESGEARIDSFQYQGQMIADYFLSGCSEHRWLGEDTGFFSLCRLAGIHPRVEQRCKLQHVGTKVYPYYPASGAAQ